MMRYGVGGFNYDLVDDNFYHFNRLLELVLNFKRVKKVQPQMPFYKDTWLNRIQVMVARDTEKTDQGFVLVAKGGSNSESHNHNDVGSFMVYYNGFPVLIDVGNGTYTARTFSKDRYRIWSNASDYHNIPTVNGVNQYSARGTTAKNVKYQAGDRVTSFDAELQQAYPDSAGITCFCRELKIERHKQIVLNDRVETKQNAEIIQNFMTCVHPVIDQKGKIYIQTGDKKVVLTYNPKQYIATFEKMKLDMPEDLGIKERWGEVYRIRLTGNYKAMNFTSEISLSAAK